MRIAFLTEGSPTDRRIWSGTVYCAHRALAKRLDVVPIEMTALSRVLRGARRILPSLGIDPLREPACGSALAWYAARAIERAQVDAVFVLAASHIAYGLVDRFRVFHCSDATFGAMVGYHDEFTALPPRALRLGDKIEQAVIHKSAGVILSSEWAAQSAREQYGRTHGVHVVPFGANLEEIPTRDVWQRARECRLVFIGVNWREKGADVAVEATRILNERGVPAVLHIVGCLPPDKALQPAFVHLHGFLRKEVDHEYARLIELIATSDFLLLPTRFEAFGIVFCEAAAFGTPAIARRTGGVPTVIEDGATGALLPPEARPDAYADQIQAIWSDPSGYARMRENAFARSRQVLNWDAWAESVERIMRDALAAGGRAPGYTPVSGLPARSPSAMQAPARQSAVGLLDELIRPAAAEP